MCPTSPDIIDLISETMHTRVSEKQTALLDPVLTPMKRALVDRIMKDFWIIFNQEWSANIHKCSGSPSTSSSTSAIQGAHAVTESSSTNKQKRQREDDDDSNSREDGNEDPAWRKDCPSETQNKKKKFACPYRKRDPRKYNYCTRSWRTCALTSFDTIARVKYALSF